jgi:hypothetical protein
MFGNVPFAELGVKGATERKGTHTGHFELAPVHRMMMHRLSSPGLNRSSASSGLDRRSVAPLPSSDADSGHDQPYQDKKDGAAQQAEGDGSEAARLNAKKNWKKLSEAYKTASSAVRASTCVLSAGSEDAVVFRMLCDKARVGNLAAWQLTC